MLENDMFDDLRNMHSVLSDIHEQQPMADGRSIFISSSWCVDGEHHCRAHGRAWQSEQLLLGLDPPHTALVAVVL